jgi:uncharacterized protein (TIRG00374 family)
LKDDFNKIIDIIIHINPLWIIMAMVLMILSWFFSSLALYTLSKDLEKNFKLKDLFKSIIITNFFGSITPYGVGGQPFQIYNLHKKGMKLANATNIIIEFFKLHQITVVILGFLAVFLNYKFNYFPDDNALKNFVVIGFVMNIAIIIFLIFVSKGTKVCGNLIKK